MLLLLGVSAASVRADEPLYLQPPTDLVVLNRANASSRIETFPLDFPNRRPPSPLPRGGALKARLLDTPGEVEIAYSKIERIELFEQRLLSAAKQHVAKKEFGQAYDYFARLDRDYPEWPGFADTFSSALRAEALARFRSGEEDHALALLHTLFDRAPQLAGLDRAVDTIGESILSARWKAGDYGGVRRAIDTLRKNFAGLKLSVGDRWLGKMSDGASQLRERAKQLASQKRTREALRLISDASALDPTSVETRALLKELSGDDNTLWVGVWETAAQDATPRLDRPAARRQSRLIGGRLATLEAYPPEGSEYASALGPIEVAAGRRRMTIGGRGSSRAAFRLSRALLDREEPASDPLAQLRSQSAAVSIDADGALVIDLKSPHPRPEALAKAALPPGLTDAAPGGWRRVPTLPGSKASARYERVGGASGFEAIEEFAYQRADQAIDALRAGEIHLLANVPPWKTDAVDAIPRVQISAKRLPTLHCLLMSDNTPLRERRELRRAICYALARKETLESLVLGGRSQGGAAVLSAPFPRGASLSDPVRYAYNVSVDPRPYEPRLAALLLAAARATDAEAAEAATKAKEEGLDPPPAKPPTPQALTLAHPPTPTARAVVKAFNQLLATIGIETTLIEASEADLTSGVIDCDLRYAEITMAEPLVDAWSLLGPGGVSGGCSPPMLAGLQRVRKAKAFNEASEALNDLHRIAFADLPLIPLWQTVDNFAYVDSLRGVPDETIELYQTVDDWSLGSGGGR
ncbi:Bacterial extracellular solute-binding protein, family 5 Middle [Planctomycetes bacterium MalM25]|nr:Bacterial extracellular solute-binding protein, family 5 Middle [Planctomycetes bacterium MalM25]